MDIKTYVEQRFPLLEQDSALEYSRNAMIHSKQIGLTHGLDIAVGFAEWILDNCSEEWDKWVYENDIYTHKELLLIYLDTLKTK